MEEEQTTQWSKEKVQKDKQPSTKHTNKTKDWLTRTPRKLDVSCMPMPFMEVISSLLIFEDCSGYENTNLKKGLKIKHSLKEGFEDKTLIERRVWR